MSCFVVAMQVTLQSMIIITSQKFNFQFILFFKMIITLVPNISFTFHGLFSKDMFSISKYLRKLCLYILTSLRFNFHPRICNKNLANP